MGRKTKSSRNSNKKGKKKNGRRNSNNKSNQTAHNAEPSPPPATATSSPSNDYENNHNPNPSSFENNIEQDLTPPPKEEPVGTVAMIVNLKRKTDLNGRFGMIQSHLPNGRVAVEFTHLQGTRLERKETFAVKKENLKFSWHVPDDEDDEGDDDDDEGEVCPICMETVLVTKYCTKPATGCKVACCGKKICFKCWIEIEANSQPNCLRCPYCNADLSVNTDDATLAMIRARAERGDVDAMFELASIYQYGAMGLPQDLAKTRFWWHKAAVHGSARASFYLGNAFLTGQGGPVDDAEGVRWLHVASDKGYLQANTTLGNHYLFGDMDSIGNMEFGKEDKNIDLGKKLLQKSIDAGDFIALRILENYEFLESARSQPDTTSPDDAVTDEGK